MGAYLAHILTKFSFVGFGLFVIDLDFIILFVTRGFHWSHIHLSLLVAEALRIGSLTLTSLQRFEFLLSLNTKFTDILVFI